MGGAPNNTSPRTKQKYIVFVEYVEHKIVVGNKSVLTNIAVRLIERYKENVMFVGKLV